MPQVSVYRLQIKCQSIIVLIIITVTNGLHVERCSLDSIDCRIFATNFPPEARGHFAKRNRQSTTTFGVDCRLLFLLHEQPTLATREQIGQHRISLALRGHREEKTEVVADYRADWLPEQLVASSNLAAKIAATAEAVAKISRRKALEFCYSNRC